MPVNHTSLTWHSLLYQTNLPLDHSPHQMTIFRIERLSPIETQKHCISNSLKYNASLHFLYRHVDIITLLSCTLSGSDCIYQKKKPAVYSRTTDFLYYSFYLLRCVSDKFSIFKHNLLPSRYPSSLLSAPITFAMDCATEGFSAITNFIFFHSNFVSFFHFLFAF